MELTIGSDGLNRDQVGGHIHSPHRQVAEPGTHQIQFRVQPLRGEQVLVRGAAQCAADPTRRVDGNCDHRGW
ncbi:hypothetical protein TL10_16725 [Mycolicibacterium llatzerense]|uniref:Uncharacterized protein n=1 Tax=Mycolicibacterium llatzerense TaxID=280871 RepID=A0A0D1LCE0_9MYCO|nr:hypothetical protein TL10_16725 [Mycolicibacterium llatzerense]MCT7369817.1 hypothetical protein [Mycolicibacterium llatzerense]